MHTAESLKAPCVGTTVFMGQIMYFFNSQPLILCIIDYCIALIVIEIQTLFENEIFA